MLPVLTTFTSSGKIIDKRNIFVSTCGGVDCGYSFENGTIIKKDFSIYAYCHKTHYECDSLDIEIPESKYENIDFIEGKLLPNGKIEMSEIKTKIPNSNN
jgi:hypothetical protein